VISQAADWVKAHPGYVAHVNGFASTIGSRQANVLLADLRAQIVVDQLASDGLAAARIRQRGRGPVPFALTAQESRRVEIRVNRH
jgi:outer membrane protein OmpA-like peptidoglycan-associated protein